MLKTDWLVLLGVALMAAAVALHHAAPGALAALPLLLVAGMASSRRGRWQATAVWAPATLLALWVLAQTWMPDLRWQLSETRMLQLLAAITVQCGGLLYLFPVLRLPRPNGAHQVGVIDFEMTDANRADPFEPEQRRRVWARIWYPATPAAGAQPAPYFTREEAAVVGGGLARLMKAPRFVLNHLRCWRTWSYRGAPLKTGLGRLPVVLFQHGAGFYPTQNTSLMESLASHGYVAIAVGHAHESSGVLYADGSAVNIHERAAGAFKTFGEKRHALIDFLLADSVEEGYKGLDRLLNQELKHHLFVEGAGNWQADASSILSALGKTISGPVGEIARACELSRYACVGMSYGSSVAATTADTDPRCAAAVMLDGLLWDWNLVDKDIGKPVLLLCSENRPFVRLIHWVGRLRGPKQPPAFQMNDFFLEPFASAGEHPQVQRYDVSGAQHLAFTDLCLLLPWPWGGWSGFGKLRPARMLQLVAGMTREFLDRNYRGGAQAQDAAAWPEAVRYSAANMRRLSNLN